MIDHIQTADMKLVRKAADALVARRLFKTTVKRPNAEPPVQHWKGYVTAVQTHGPDMFRIEVQRLD